MCNWIVPVNISTFPINYFLNHTIEDSYRPSKHSAAGPAKAECRLLPPGKQWGRGGHLSTHPPSAWGPVRLPVLMRHSVKWPPYRFVDFAPLWIKTHKNKWVFYLYRYICVFLNVLRLHFYPSIHYRIPVKIKLKKSINPDAHLECRTAAQCSRVSAESKTSRRLCGTRSGQKL